MNPPITFIDPSVTIGDHTRVWHFTVILADVVIGANGNIGSRCEIGRGCRIGNRVRIGSGVFLPPNAVIGDDVFIGPNVTCTDDKWPIAGNADYDAQPPIIVHGASIGAGAVLLPGVVIGAGAMVGAGAIVTADVDPGAIVRGNNAARECGRMIHQQDS